MNQDTPDPSHFLRPVWGRGIGTPWVVSLLILAILAAARFYAVLGPPGARILFLVHALVMWVLPFIFLTPQGRRDIGLRKPRNTPSALAWSTLAGAAMAAHAACNLAMISAAFLYYF